MSFAGITSDYHGNSDVPVKDDDLADAAKLFATFCGWTKKTAARVI